VQIRTAGICSRVTSFAGVDKTKKQVFLNLERANMRKDDRGQYFGYIPLACQACLNKVKPNTVEENGGTGPAVVVKVGLRANIEPERSLPALTSVQTSYNHVETLS
jgi:hypothetical protein